MTPPSLPVRLDGGELAIATEGLAERYGPCILALAGLALRVPAGSVYVLAGPNGAGKSTAMKVLLDLVRADRGTAHVCGLRTTADPARVRAHIGYVPEVVETAYGWLTAGALLAHPPALFGARGGGGAPALFRRPAAPPHLQVRSASQ